MNTPWDKTEEDLVYLRQHFRANVIRALGDSSPLRYPEEPHAFNEFNWEKLHRLCAAAHRAGLYVVIDPHTTPGTERPTITVPEDLLWHNARYHDLLVETWKRLAKEFKGRPEIIGYDLMNEPNTPENPSPDSPADWNGLAKRLVKAIRAEDPDTPIVIEPAEDLNASWWHNSSVPGRPKLSKDIGDKRIVFSPHFYDPKQFTYQGTTFSTIAYPFGLTYPGGTFNWGTASDGTNQKVRLGREWIEVYLRSMVEFAHKAKASIFIGEFSAVRTAPGGDEYIADLIGMFEK
jgi:aryl-phospho-beta-D-glucosidase BglC (GH1 family)